ncbi:ESPR-type extended signal peptide-containing protein, partial [Acinetobacter radioresistens]|uniref:ESPR-type extended signal peptide-containing protein n=1 Tax=Acinetobacter radioresistens TaxID=40216 RepID=UPI003A800996
MNKVYRVVWNASLAIWVAVSELARSQTKRSQGGLVHAEQGAISAQSNSSTARFNYKLNPLTQMIGLSLGLSTLLATTSVMAVTGKDFVQGVDPSCFYDVTTKSVICGDETTTVNDSAQNTVVMGTGATANNTADIVIGLNAANGFIPRGELNPANQAQESNQFFVNGVKAKFVDTTGLAQANAKPATLSNVVIGEAAGTNATGARNIVIGKNAATSHYGDDSITLGTNANNFKLNGAQDGTKADTVTRARQTVAVGVNSMTYNDDAIAVGNSAKAYHGKAIAIGPNARAGNSIGVRQNIVQSGAIAMGSGAVAPLGGDIAIGVSSGSKVSQDIPTTTAAGGNVTIGNNAGSGSYSYSSVALGNGSGQSMGSVNAPQRDNTVVGSSSGNNVKGDTNTAIGWQVGSNIGSNTNTAVGARTGQNIAGANNVAFSIYSGNMVLGSSNISMGDRTGQFVGVHKDAVRYDTATKKFVDANGVAVATATGTNNIAMGSQAGSYVAGQGNFALGENTGNYVNYHPVTSAMVGGQGGNLAFGKNAGNYINGSNNIAFGQGAGAGSLQEILQRNNTINLGYGAIAYKSDALAFGNSAKAHTANSLSFGKDSEAGTAGSTTAINALAIGTGAKALAKNAISIGTGNVVSGENSGAIGDPSIIDGANSYSVGNNNAIGAASQNVFVLGNEVQIGEDGTTNVSGAVALGHASDVIVKNGVALGSSSVADRDALVTPSVATTATVADNQIFGLDSSTIEDKTAIQNTVVGNLGAVSVGSDTATRQITHVAAGSEDSDAVNVAQLKAVANTPLGFTDDADTQLTRKLGENLHVKGGASGTLTDNNIGVVANGTDTLTVKLAEDIDLGTNGSVTTGNTVVNANGLTINNPADTTKTVSVTSGGINAGGNVISNVAAGSAATDAVNVSQLEDAQAAATTEVVEGKNISVSSSIGTDGQTIYTVATDEDVNFNQVTIGSTTGNNTILTSTADGLSVGGDKITNVAAGTISDTSTDAVNGSQLYATNQNVATNSNNITNLQNQTFKLQANGDTASAVKASDTVQFLNGENINITRNGNDITVATAKAVAFDKVTVGNVVVDKTTNKITGIEAGT